MKKCSIPAAWKQASLVTDGRPILVVTKDDHRPAEVTMKQLGFTPTMQLTSLLEMLRTGWRPSSPSLPTPSSGASSPSTSPAPAPSTTPTTSPPSGARRSGQARP